MSKNNNIPLVSICCLTYNHEKFIKETLDGFLLQKTNFKFEIVIHDDASTDKTRNIIDEYHNQYPDILHPIFQTENQYSKGRKPLSEFVFPATKGKYLALCEGDDFWVDLQKLQIQIDFLEKHESCSSCFHPVYWLENGKINQDPYAPVIKKEFYDENDVLSNNLQNTICSTVFRKAVIEDKLDFFNGIPYSDMMLHIMNARFGKIGYIDRTMATYRRHVGGVYSGSSEYKRLKNTIKCIEIIREKFNYHNNPNIIARLKLLVEKKGVLKAQANDKKYNNNVNESNEMNSQNNKSELEIVKTFNSAVTNFNNGNLPQALKDLEDYKLAVDYNDFEMTDNRKQKNPKVSVVVVAYNTNKLLVDCLESVYKNDYDNYEIIVVDNGGNEEVESELKSMSLLYIKCPTNFILSEGRNIGVYFAQGEIINFLDDDALVPTDYLSTTVEAFETYNIVGFRGKVLPKTESKNNQLAKHYNLGEIPIPASVDTEGNSAFLREKYLEVGGMNALLFGGEGTDLSYRLAKIYSVNSTIYWPKTIIYHDYAKTDDKLSKKSDRHILMHKYMVHLFPDVFAYHNYLANYAMSDELQKKGEKELFRFSFNDKNIFISVCIPTYNRADFLKEAVDSALNQNYENYEILIVDDGSTDNTAEMVKSINSDKIRYFKSEENLGRPKVRNKLVSLAKGEFLLWLDDDDKLRENIITKYVRVLQNNPEVNIIYGNLLQFDSETGEEIQRFEPNDYSNSKADMLSNLILGRGLTFGSSLMKKELFEQCGLFDEEYLRAQDYDLWFRLFERANFYKINEIVYYYRKHNDNISFSTLVDKSYEAKTVKKVLLEYSINDLFIKFDLSNQEVLDNVHYHLALSLYNFQDYGTAIFYLNKIKNSANEDRAKLTFASYLSIGDSGLINNFIESLKPIKELKKLNQEFDTIIKNKNALSSKLEKIVKLSKWNKLEDLVIKMSNEFGYIAEVPYYLGVLNENNNDLEMSLKYYMQAIRFNPNNKNYYESALRLTDENSKRELNKMRKRVLMKTEDENISNGKELISVIIPTYNRGKYITTSLNSVLNQTYQNFEIIVVNDGGNDVSEIIENLNDSRIKYISSKTNQGPAAARNIGLKNANGKYISYLDDDDSYYPNHLSTLIDQLENSNFKVAYTDAYCVQRVGAEGNEIISSKTIPYSIEFSKEILLIMNIAPTQCFMHAKECITKVGEFDEDLGTHEDWDFWVKMSLKYDFIHIKKVTSEFNRRESLGSLTTNKLEDFLSTMKIIYKRYKNDVKNNVEILKAQQARVDELMDQIKKSKNEASIIIVTYNSEESIESCLSSLAKTIREYDEVVVVDNNSKDNTIRIIEKSIENLEQFTLIKSDVNLGFSEGCNVGLRNSSNPFVVLLNPDTIVTNNWLDKMVTVCKTKDVAAVGPISNYAAGAQNVIAYLNSDELKEIESKELPNEIETRFNKKVVETKLLIGFCMVIKRDLLNELGGLDKELFLGNDDLDLSWQFRLKGYKLLVAIDTFVYHEGQVSFNTEEESVINPLVEESTNKLYEKLICHYGKGNVPTPIELWGMNWFTPTNGRFNKSSKLLDTKTKGVSIVIPTFNQWEYTKQTIESIEEFTNYSYEIIIVDNASTDDTLVQLEKYKSIKVIANDKNLGFPKAINQGILESKGDYILLLNNDVVVTKGWLTKMVEVANMEENIGIVGPISNAVSGLQIDKDAKYSTMDEMHIYAKQISDKNKNQILDFPRVAFLCTLIKKEVIEKIGGLDERFSPGNFEDDDFCLRSQLSGYKTIIAKDVFIHHYGSVSFKANGNNEYNKRLETNKKIFVNKWGHDLEEIWLKGKKVNERKLECAINKDLFAQSIARAFINIDDQEYDFAIGNIKLSLENFDNSDRIGYEKVTKEELFNLAGTVSLAKNDLEVAKEYFEQELNFNPNSSNACFGLGEVFYQAEMITESKSMFEWAVVNNTDNQNAKIRLREVNTKLDFPDDHNSIQNEIDEGVS